MSDHVSFDIQIEIMTRVPIKSLIRFTSVSKTWKSLNRSSKFIADYTKHHSQRQHFLITYMNHSSYPPQNCFVSIADDNTFPEHKLFLTTPNSLILEEFVIVGNSHGLLCFTRVLFSNWKIAEVIIWNPSIRKTDVIQMHKVKKSCSCYQDSVVGFGVCPNTIDPKIVKICRCKCNVEVEVFTLSSRVWRSSLSNTNIMLRKDASFCFDDDNVVIDGFICWLVYEIGKPSSDDMIVLFDLTSEKFMEIQFPNKIRLSRQSTTKLFKLRESVAVVLRTMNPNVDIEVWKMEINDVTRSFTKLFNINILPDLSYLYGLTKNGQLIFEKQHIHDHKTSFHVIAYDPCAKSINYLKI
ncbi:F-box/kelch-repeat protein At3g23880-like [Rutidosis leptorrhynchoides]|uniref:F-box/kelch-repeat protein At3g23880-like n=1 Tax=Rutidosis leptorrhynchoides TaxID=125765 RepID=UPI003A99B1E9